MTTIDVAAYVATSRREQGLPEHVDDAATIERLASILDGAPADEARSA